MASVETEHFEALRVENGNPLGIIPAHDSSADAMRHKSENVLRLKAEGKSMDCIAREAGVSRSTVTRIMRYVERASAG
ncbi:helix-turn-helix domain-containing protein [Rhizobium mayense]|uniref:Helix-turn-helix domain-containing protein n=1 Tax=Rhizobium mayense TaxID=1312184 RepID=A0ABT7JQK5_9HYPH|nr:helix-turn-helix domain-containing protein [Rhizobium mayense]MDL2398635.1 helix-turn-helix domain-containing protein [Rhizobium mayense]